MRSIARKNHGVIYLPLRTPCLYVDSPTVRRASSAGHCWARKDGGLTVDSSSLAKSRSVAKKKTAPQNASRQRPRSAVSPSNIVDQGKRLDIVNNRRGWTLRRGADTNESRANRTINRTRRRLAERERRGRAHWLRYSLAHARCVSLFVLWVPIIGRYESNSTLTELQLI